MIAKLNICRDWHAAGAKNGKEWTEQGLKSRLYKKIVDIFPEGYTNNNIISRERTCIHQTAVVFAKRGIELTTFFMPHSDQIEEEEGGSTEKVGRYEKARGL